MRGLARLLFTLDSPRRDGPLQRWLASLYSKVAGNRVESAEGLVKRLDADDFGSRRRGRSGVGSSWARSYSRGKCR